MLHRLVRLDLRRSAGHHLAGFETGSARGVSAGGRGESLQPQRMRKNPVPLARSGRLPTSARSAPGKHIGFPRRYRGGLSNRRNCGDRTSGWFISSGRTLSILI